MTERDMSAVAQLAQGKCWHRSSMLIGPDLAIAWVSPSIRLVVGWQPEDIVGRSALDMLHPDDVDAVVGILAFESEVDATVRVDVGQRAVKEVRMLRPDGTFATLEVALTNFFDDPEIGMLLIDVASPTQFRDVDRAIELTRIGGDLGDILTVVVKQFTTGHWAQPAAVVFDRSGRVLTATVNAPEPYGPVAPETYQNVWEIELVESANADAVGIARFWGQNAKAHPFDLESSVRVARQAAVAMGRHRATLELQRAALSDPLTGIPNRRALEQDLKTRLDRADEVLLVYLDLDGFKEINDRYGHAAGDHVLRIVAERLTSSLRVGDVAARIGGDEFVLLLGSPPPPTEALSQRLAQSINAPIALGTEMVQISASVGFGSGQTDPDSLLRSADRAMLRSKHRR